MGNPRIRLGLLFRRWWLAVLVATVGGALVAYALGSRVSTTYEATAQVLVDGSPALAPTYAELVKSTPVLAYALRSTNVDVPIGTLQQRVRGESNQETRFIAVRADAPTGREAIALANALAAGLRSYVSAAAGSSDSAPQPPEVGYAEVQIVEPADSATRIRPQPALALVFGAATGLFATLAVAFVVEIRKPRALDEEGLDALGSVPVLGSVNGGLPSHVPAVDPNRGGAEEAASYRRLATRISLANREQEPGSLLVLGAHDTRSSALVATKLALTAARDGRRVVLADFGGRHDVGELFGLGGSPTPRTLKRSKPFDYEGVTFDRYSIRTGDQFVLALPRQVQPELSSEVAEQLLLQLSADTDVVVLHGPTPSRSRVALTWARVARATILVIQTEHTSRADVESALAGLEPIAPKFLGAVLQGGTP